MQNISQFPICDANPTQVYQTYLQMSKQVNDQKAQTAILEIQGLENTWYGWLAMQQNHNQIKELNQKVECSDHDSSKQTDIGEKNTQLKKFFENLRRRMLEEKLYMSLTSSQMATFFEETNVQIGNKIRLFEDIQKLKLLSCYPSHCKRTYSKQANVILKKWLIENYQNPYPTPTEIVGMVETTNLSQKQILNWFINARNSLKNKQNQEKKFKHVVEARFQEIQKKIKKELHQ